MYHPSRGGVRGGADQFDWEDVKLDKHRESYLGHSVMAPVGRWQKGKDLQWYTKSGKVNSQLSKQKEKDAIKQLEAEALAVALGKGAPKKTTTGLTKQELAEVCRKGQVERDSMDIERVEGMGFGSSRARLMDTSAVPVKETLVASQSDLGGQPQLHSREEQKSNINGAQASEKESSKEKKKRRKDKKEKKKSKKEKKHKRQHHADNNSSPEERKKLKRDYDYSSPYGSRESKHRHHDSSSESHATSVESAKRSGKHRSEYSEHNLSKQRHKEKTRAIHAQETKT